MVSTPVAPYARVKQHLKDGLASGRWPPGALMPSEADLVAEFKVSRMTVGRALRELQAEGLVERTQGVGTFAAGLHKVSSTLTIHDLHEEIVARGHPHEARVHLQRAEPAPAALAAQLGVAAGSTVFHTLIVHLENGVPLQVHTRFMLVAAGDDLFVQVMDGERAAHLVQRRRKGAHALRAFDQALSLQLAQRAASGHAADVEFSHQVGFRGHQRAGRPAA